MSAHVRARPNSAASATSSRGGPAASGRRSAQGHQARKQQNSSKKRHPPLHPRTQDLLLTAVSAGDVAKLKKVLTRERVHGLNQPLGNGGRTLLIQAIVSDQSEIVRALFEVAEEVPGAPALDVDRVCMGLRKTPLQHAMTRAAKTRAYDMVQLLLERGANCVFPSSSTGKATTNALFDAIRLRDARLVDMLCAHDASLVFTTSPQGWLPLQSACSEDHTQVVKQLLCHGADPRDKSTMGISCFQFALGKRRPGSKKPPSKSPTSSSSKSKGRKPRPQAQHRNKDRASVRFARHTNHVDDDGDDDEDGVGRHGGDSAGGSGAVTPALTTDASASNWSSSINGKAPAAVPRATMGRGPKTGNAPRMREKRMKERTGAFAAARASVRTTVPSSRTSPVAVAADRGAARNTRSERTSTTAIRSRHKARPESARRSPPISTTTSSRKTPSSLGKKGRNRFRACDDILRLLAAQLLVDVMRATALRMRLLRAKAAATTIQRNVRRIQAQRQAQKLLAFERQCRDHKTAVHNAVFARAREVLRVQSQHNQGNTHTGTGAVGSEDAAVEDAAAIEPLCQLIRRACGDPRTANDSSIPVLNSDRVTELLQVPLQRVQAELLPDVNSATEADSSPLLSPAACLQRVVHEEVPKDQTYMNLAHLVLTVLPRAGLRLCDVVTKITVAGKDTQLSDMETGQQQEMRACLPSCFRYGTEHSSQLPSWLLPSTVRAMRAASSQQHGEAHAEGGSHVCRMMTMYARVLVASYMHHTRTMLLHPPQQATASLFVGVDVALVLMLVRCVLEQCRDHTLKPSVEKQVARHASELLRFGAMQRYREQGIPEAQLETVGQLLRQAVGVVQGNLSVGSPLELAQMDTIADIAQCVDAQTLLQHLPDSVMGLMVNGVTVLAKVLESGRKDAVTAYFKSVQRHIEHALQDHDLQRVQNICNSQLNRQRTAVADAFKPLVRGNCSHRDAYECITVLLEHRVPLPESVLVPLMQLSRDVHGRIEETCPLLAAARELLAVTLEQHSSSSLWPAVWIINTHLEDALSKANWQQELCRAQANSSAANGHGGMAESVASTGVAEADGSANTQPVVTALLQTEESEPEREVRGRCLKDLRRTAEDPWLEKAIARVSRPGLNVSWSIAGTKQTDSGSTGADLSPGYAISTPGTFPMTVKTLTIFFRVLDACDLSHEGIGLVMDSFAFVASTTLEKSDGEDDGMMDVFVRYIRRMLKRGTQQEQLRKDLAEKLAGAIKQLCLTTPKRSRYFRPTAKVQFERLPFCARLHQSLPEVKDAVSEHLSCTSLLHHLRGHLTNVKLSDKERNNVQEFMRVVFPDFLKCRICLEEPKTPIALCKQSGGEHYRKIQCRHHFCKECVQQWLHHGIESGQTAFRCPIQACRFALYPDDVRRLATESDYKRYKVLMSQNYDSRLRALRRDGLLDVVNSSCCICPRCHVVIERAAGCDTMRCICGHVFRFHQDTARPSNVLSRDGRA